MWKITAFLSGLLFFGGEVKAAACEIREDLLGSMRPEEVLVYFSGWEEGCKDSGLVAYHRAAAKYQMGDLFGAIKTLEPVVASAEYEDRFPSLFLYAGLILKAGESGRARKILLDLNAFDPEHDGVIALLARASLAERKFKDAHMYALQAIDRNWNVAAMYAIGISSLYELSDYEGVIDLYSVAIEQGLQDQEIFLQADIGARVAVSFFKMGDKRRSSSVFEVVFSLHPEFRRQKVIAEYVAALKREGYLK